MTRCANRHQMFAFQSGYKPLSQGQFERFWGSLPEQERRVLMSLEGLRDWQLLLKVGRPVTNPNRNPNY